MLRKFPVSNAERYSDADLEVSQYLCLHMKIICLRFVIRTPFTVRNMWTWDMWEVCLQTFRNKRIC